MREILLATFKVKDHECEGQNCSFCEEFGEWTYDKEND